MIAVAALAVNLEYPLIGQEHAAGQALDTVVSLLQVCEQPVIGRESGAAGAAAKDKGTRCLIHFGLPTARPGHTGTGLSPLVAV